MHPIRSPWSKAGLKFQQKQWKTHTHGSLTILSSMITWARKRKRDIKGFLEFNKNEGTAYPNLRSTMKAELKGKAIALSSFIQKLEETEIRDFSHYQLKSTPESSRKKEANVPKRSR